MNRKNFFIFLAVIIVSFILLIFSSMWFQASPPPQDSSKIETPRSPFKSFIFGTGIVKANGGNIHIGTNINRIVETIPVKGGEKVKRGQQLIIFENKDLQADLMIEELAYQMAQTNLKKMKELPREEDLIFAKAAFKNAELEAELASSQYEMVERLGDLRALSQEEVNRRSFASQLADAKLSQAKATFDKIKAGAWRPDLEIAELEVIQQRAKVMQKKSYLQRTIIKSPIDATVLKIDIREGEVPSPDSSRSPLMIIGDLDTLSLYVSINKFDVPFFNRSSPAVGFLQGDGTEPFSLEFLRLDPILVKKENLTNAISERVDTEVLTVIYRIKPTKQQLFVGQQMDVYIETEFPENQI